MCMEVRNCCAAFVIMNYRAQREVGIVQVNVVDDRRMRTTRCKEDWLHVDLLIPRLWKLHKLNRI